MNLEEIRQLPDGPIPHTFIVQLKETKFPAQGGKPAKVKLTDGTVGQVSAVIWRPTVPLEQLAWYEVTPGQDNQKREKVHIQTKEWKGKEYRELSIDGTAFTGPVEAPEPTHTSSQGESPRGRERAASGAVQRREEVVPSDREMVAWLQEAGEEVVRVVSSWGDPTTPHGEAAVITTVGSILTGMRIGAEHGKLRLTYGQKAKRPGAEREAEPEDRTTSPDPWPASGQEEPDDDIPF